MNEGLSRPTRGRLVLPLRAKQKIKFQTKVISVLAMLQKIGTFCRIARNGLAPIATFLQSRLNTLEG